MSNTFKESETQLTLQDIVAEVATKGMIGMQLAMGDGSSKHHEKVLKEAEQLIQSYVTQALTSLVSELEGMKKAGERPHHMSIFDEGYNQALSEAQKLIRGKL